MNPSPTLTDADRAYIRRIISTPATPLWMDILTGAFFPLYFIAIGVCIKMIPIYYQAAGIALCARHRSVWTPIGEGTESFAKFGVNASGAIFVETMILTALVWAWFAEHRRTREIFTKAFPEGMAPPDGPKPTTPDAKEKP